MMADCVMPSGLLRKPGAWVVDTRLLTSGAAPTAALDRARTSFLMPCAEDATAARLQSLSAVARGGGTASQATAGGVGGLAHVMTARSWRRSMSSLACRQEAFGRMISDEKVVIGCAFSSAKRTASLNRARIQTMLPCSHHFMTRDF